MVPGTDGWGHQGQPALGPGLPGRLLAPLLPDGPRASLQAVGLSLSLRRRPTASLCPLEAGGGSGAQRRGPAEAGLAGVWGRSGVGEPSGEQTIRGSLPHFF